MSFVQHTLFVCWKPRLPCRAIRDRIERKCICFFKAAVVVSLSSKERVTIPLLLLLGTELQFVAILETVFDVSVSEG